MEGRGYDTLGGSQNYSFRRPAILPSFCTLCARVKLHGLVDGVDRSWLFRLPLAVEVVLDGNLLKERVGAGRFLLAS